MHLAASLQAACGFGGQVDEIIVVDNAADETTRAFVARFEGVRYIAAPFNGGCEGRNIALGKSTSDLLVTLDDDVQLLQHDALEVVRRAFSSDQRLAVLNFTVVDGSGRVLARDWCHPRPIAHVTREFETCFILEGASALRRREVILAGGYPANFFLGHEGVDLAYRLIDRGYKVLHTPHVSAVHTPAQPQRPGWRLYYYYTRNGIWIAYRHFPVLKAALVAFENTAKMVFFAIRAGQLTACLRGCLDGARELPRIERRRLTHPAIQRLKRIRAERPAFTARVWKHLGEHLL